MKFKIMKLSIILRNQMNIKTIIFLLSIFSIISFISVNNVWAQTITRLTFDLTVPDDNMFGAPDTLNDVWIEFSYDETGTVAHSYDHTTDPSTEVEHNLSDFTAFNYTFISDAIVTYNSSLYSLLSQANEPIYDTTNSVVVGKEFEGNKTNNFDIIEREWRFFAQIVNGDIGIVELTGGFKTDSGEVHYEWLYGYNANFTHTVSPVPEPATVLLFSLGLIGLAVISRKKQPLS